MLPRRVGPEVASTFGAPHRNFLNSWLSIPAIIPRKLQFCQAPMNNVLTLSTLEFNGLARVVEPKDEEGARATHARVEGLPVISAGITGNDFDSRFSNSTPHSSRTAQNFR
jgi:hypothetical protein